MNNYYTWTIFYDGVINYKRLSLLVFQGFLEPEKINYGLAINNIYVKK